MNRKTTIVTLAIVLAITEGGPVVRAGDLNPPAGPVAPTQRALISSLPFTISQPGSYVVTGDLTGVSPSSGITITVDHVTIDLNGFSLIGVPGTIDGIVTSGTRKNIVIKNGTLTAWGQDGIDCLATQSRVENVRAIANTSVGIRVSNDSVITGCVAQGNTTGIALSTASYCRVIDCTVTGNTVDGIVTSTRCLVRGCQASNNSGDGIRVSSDSLIEGCAAHSNTVDGIDAGISATIDDCAANSNGAVGIRISNNGNVRHCTANNNTLDGFTLSNGSSISNSMAVNNADDGFGLNPDCTAQGCTAFSNDDVGIEGGSGCIIQACTANSNGGGAATTNKHGIDLSGNARVVDCIARSNDGDGIQSSSGSVITGCTIDGNDGDGIEVTLHCLVSGNACHANGFGAADGAGIHATSSDNRIEGNNVTNNDRGIDVDTGGNLVIRNSANTNTTNYDIVAANTVGTIVATEAAMNAATNSNVNISY